LVAVEPASLALLHCAKTGDRSGAAWQAVLEPFTNLEFVVSDAAKGIAAGVQAVAATRADEAVSLEHGLDVFHTAQEAQRVLAGPWRRAEAAWDEAVAADAKVAECKRQGRDARGAALQASKAWTKAKALLAKADRQESAWQRARAALAVFRADGTVSERSWAEAEIAGALAELSGPEWKKVRNFLTDGRALAFLDRLQCRLIEAEPDERLRAACLQRWWLRRQPPASVDGTTALAEIEGVLNAVLRDRPLNAVEQAAYERVSAVLRSTVRASSAVEGMNSVLRMQQGRHRRITQCLLDLKRIYWNCRKLTSGKRRGKSPYEHLGVPLPTTDFWTLIQPQNRQRAQEVSC
jgi:hypothetical protein